MNEYLNKTIREAIKRNLKEMALRFSNQLTKKETMKKSDLKTGMIVEFRDKFHIEDLTLIWERNEKPELNKWYKNGNGATMFYYDGKLSGRYGINANGNWSNDIDAAYDNNLTLATDDEVKEMLIKEAKKRYDKNIIKCLHGYLDSSIDNIGQWEFEKNVLRYYGLDKGCGCVFDNGKWAEIIKVEKPFMELDGIEYSKDTIRSIIKKATK